MCNLTVQFHDFNPKTLGQNGATICKAPIRTQLFIHSTLVFFLLFDDWIVIKAALQQVLK